MAYPSVLREADDQLLRQAYELETKLAAFTAGAGEFLPRGFDPAAEAQAVRELAEESRRLSQWVAQVGAAFRAADGGGGWITDLAERWLGGEGTGADALVVVPTAALAGVVGFPSRDVAVAEGRRLAAELQRLLTTPLDEAELQALVEDLARGRNDPAFAATFSNLIGVEGYVAAMGLIAPRAYEGRDRQVTSEGLAAVGVLAEALSTALRTLPGAGRGYVADSSLTDDQRLSEDFEADLLTTRALELSVLMRFTKPSTSLAVELASAHLTLRLEAGRSGMDLPAFHSPWGELASTTANYATMLAGDPKASALWLAADQNLELVLTRPGSYDLDGGKALAATVENGLTHPTLRTSIPGAPSYAQGPLLREKLLDIAIDTIADQGEIRNEYLHAAFAAGVAANLDHISTRINAAFDVGENSITDHIREQYLNAHDFLRETMKDLGASLTIRQAVFEYGFGQVTSPPPELRDERLTRLGRLEAVITEAQKNAEIGGAVEVALASSGLGPTPGSFVDGGLTLAGNTPYPPLLAASAVNDIGTTLGYSAGDVVDFLHQPDTVDTLVERLDQANDDTAERRSLDAQNEAIWLATGLYDPSTELGAALKQSAEDFHADNNLAGDERFIDENGMLISTMTNKQAINFVEWADDAVGHPDNRDAPLYDIAGNLNDGFDHVMREAAGDRDIVIEGRR